MTIDRLFYNLNLLNYAISVNKAQWLVEHSVFVVEMFLKVMIPEHKDCSGIISMLEDMEGFQIAQQFRTVFRTFRTTASTQKQLEEM